MMNLNIVLMKAAQLPHGIPTFSKGYLPLNISDNLGNLSKPQKNTGKHPASS